MIRHATALPHAVGALPIAMIQPTRVAALVPLPRSSCADNAGSGAAGVPAVRLASVVLAAHEERGAAPAAREHHESVVHAHGSVVHRLSTGGPQLAGLPLDHLPPSAPRCLPHHAATAMVKEFGDETRKGRALHQIHALLEPRGQGGAGPRPSAGPGVPKSFGWRAANVDYSASSRDT
jgi:hypothetical protein